MENEFFKKLKEWLDKVNNNENINDIILEKRFFTRDDAGNYYINEDNEKELKVLLQSRVCFIGDNPGKNEKNNYLYFYNNTLDKRTAGYKINKVLNEFNGNSFFYFNKCLISTNRTSDLTLKNIESTKTLVCEFLNLINKYNTNLLFMFLGLNKKFARIYNELSNETLRQSILYYHPCSYKFKLKSNDLICNRFIDIFSQDDFKYKNFMMSDLLNSANDDNDKDDGDDGLASCPVII